MTARPQARPEVTLRLAAPADAAAIDAIEHASFAEAAEIFHRRQIRYLIDHAVVWVAEAQGRVLGWAAGLLRNHRQSTSGRIYALAVHPDSRGLGLGRLLMRQVIEGLHGRGAGRIFLEVRQGNPAIGLYRKLGFVEIEPLPDYYSPGLHGVRMVLERPRRGEELGQAV